MAVPPKGFQHDGRVAQLAEHSALNRQVEGSIPSASTIYEFSAKSPELIKSVRVVWVQKSPVQACSLIFPRTVNFELFS